MMFMYEQRHIQGVAFFLINNWNDRTDILEFGERTEKIFVSFRALAP